MVVLSGQFHGFHERLSNDEGVPFIRGADISWLPQMEQSGFQFYNPSGERADVLDLLKEKGINTIRLRTWVNPTNDRINGHCRAQETVEMAKRAQQKGMHIIIDFHYSDSWSDPGKQVKPAKWVTYSFDRLKAEVYQYTYGVLNELKLAGISPIMVQIGNEINSGILMPDGSSQNFKSLVELLNAGYDAVKQVNSQTAVMLHLSNGEDEGLYQWFFDGMTKNHARYDVIGLSFYPHWAKLPLDQAMKHLEVNMIRMNKRYGKKVLIAETGGLDTKGAETYRMLNRLLTMVRQVPLDNGLGVIYWEPQAAFAWSGYRFSSFGADGKSTKALDAFLDDAKRWDDR